MLRILLVIDDYNELLYLQVLLKKLGFDVECLQNVKKYEDVSLGFNPQVLVVTGQGGRVNGLELSKSLFRPRGIPRTIALKSQANKFTDSQLSAAQIEAVVDSPVNVSDLLKAIAKVGNLDEKNLLDKYSRMQQKRAEEGGEDSGLLKGTSADEIDVLKISGSENLDDVLQQYEDRSKYKFDLNAEGSEASEKPESPKFNIQPGTKTSSQESDAGAKAKSDGKADPSVSGKKKFDMDMATSLITEELPQPAADKANADRPATDSPVAHKTSVAKNPNEPLQSEEQKNERQKRFRDFLKDKEDLEESHFERDRILAFNKMIRERGGPPDLEDIEDERKAFVRSLFKKKLD